MGIVRIAIDGPAGAGKSTIAKALAKKLGIDYIDTGAMYRAIGLKIVRSGIDMHDPKALGELLENTDVDYEAGKTYLDGEDVSGLIRTPKISAAASECFAILEVRQKLVALQRAMGLRKSMVMDGRDIGTNVLTDAEYKFYLTASPEIRAMRRVKELREKGEACDFEEIRASIIARDYQDSHREHNPLRKAEDAIEIDSSELTIAQVIDAFTAYIDTDELKEQKD
jgi:cytidylate kinase